MYLTRTKLSKKLPVSRKGTKYIAKALNNSNNGVPVVVAIRDMLKLARTSKEVKLMVKEGLLKLNGKVVKNYKEGICLFNVLEAGKKYRLTILKTGKFHFEETEEGKRIAKVVGKTNLTGGKMQVNFHDGTNIITKEKIKVGDSAEIDSENKMKKIIKVEKGKKVFVISGRSIGLYGKLKDIKGKNIKVQLEDREVTLKSNHLIVL